MRMCGHAHHDDMLYLGKDPQPSWDYPPLTDQGYANRELYAYWSARDPLADLRGAARGRGRDRAGELERIQREVEALVEARGAGGDRRAVAGRRRRPAIGVFADEPPRTRIEVLDPAVRNAVDYAPRAAAARADAPRDPKGSTFLDAVMLGVGDALRARPARVRLRRGRRRQLRQRVPAAASAAEGVRRSRSSTRRSPRAPSSASASAPRWPASGRSARCSSTTSSPPASTSW